MMKVKSSISVARAAGGILLQKARWECLSCGTVQVEQRSGDIQARLELHEVVI